MKIFSRLFHAAERSLIGSRDLPVALVLSCTVTQNEFRIYRRQPAQQRRAMPLLIQPSRRSLGYVLPHATAVARLLHQFALSLRGRLNGRRS